jgi:V8-like Glu-specific endopeptidase
MPWNEKLTALNYVLATLYAFREESVRVVREAGLDPSFIQFTNRAIDDWHNILVEAEKQNRVLNLVQAALRDYPDNSILVQAEKAEKSELPSLTSILAPTLDIDLVWRAADLSPSNLEKIMGKQSALLPIAFLEMGLERARSVARIRRQTGELGSGFLTTGNLLVTNHHVLENAQQSAQATIQFNYQQTAAGLDSEPVVFELDPGSRFATSAEDDWTLVRVKGDANADWGAIQVAPIDVTKTERVTIIQHPSGGPKQIALYHNIVTYVDDNRVQYLTDTLPGSSGSPVFDYQWRIVALHHSGGWIVEPGTKQRVVFRNEGININLIEQALSQTRSL